VWAGVAAAGACAGDIIWDSGAVSSNATSQIEYGGAALAADADYCFTVAAQEGGSGSWSTSAAPGTFSTGLLSAQDWAGAQWLGGYNALRAEFTVAAGADLVGARKWWMGELARVANDRGVDLVDLAITPVQVARIEVLVAEGALNDKLARQVIEGVLAGEGDPEEVIASRGLAVVSDDGPLLAAIEDAVTANPDVVEKITGGKPQAAGVIVGAVMKATRGQADAARVRALLFDKLGVVDE